MEHKEKLNKYLRIIGIAIGICSLIFIGFKIYWGDTKSDENDKKPEGPKSFGKNKSFGDENKSFWDEKTKEVNTNTPKEEKTNDVLKKESEYKSLNNQQNNFEKISNPKKTDEKILKSKKTYEKILITFKKSLMKTREVTEEKEITKSLNEVYNFEKIEISDSKSEEEGFCSTHRELPVVNGNLEIKETPKGLLCKVKDYLYSWTSYFSWRKDTENTEEQKTNN